MRMRKKKNAQSRMSACADIMIQNPTVLKGKWDELYGKGRQIFLEIGCGKGSFITQLAKQNPDNFYIALEVVPDVIMLAMEKAIKENISNVKFMCFDAKNLCEVFMDGELAGIYLNFSDPWPKNRHFKRRLTYIAFLEIYKKIIKNGGNIFFKTDNRPMFDFSLVQFNEAEIELCQVCTDLHNSMWEKGNIHTEYEDNFSSKGFCINRLVGKIKK
ncbi:MAG: tRNA (guanosine(46)-N7)-methyltransferase TrmB [Clostridia bacterium]|nr:tRNA (guanosine(46)-N7)-methyltransferase TrmB [Clostridia bacterium]